MEGIIYGFTNLCRKLHKLISETSLSFFHLFCSLCQTQKELRSFLLWGVYCPYMCGSMRATGSLQDVFLCCGRKVVIFRVNLLTLNIASWGTKRFYVPSFLHFYFNKNLMAPRNLKTFKSFRQRGTKLGANSGPIPKSNLMSTSADRGSQGREEVQSRC